MDVRLQQPFHAIFRTGDSEVVVGYKSLALALTATEESYLALRPAPTITLLDAAGRRIRTMVPGVTPRPEAEIPILEIQPEEAANV